MSVDKPIVAITMGDAAGIGPEITAKVFAEPALREECRPLVIGDAMTMKKVLPIAGIYPEVNAVRDVGDAQFAAGSVDVLEVPALKGRTAEFGKADPACGAASIAYVRCACELALAGRIEATTSAPTNKESMKLSGHDYKGQTEIFAEICKTTNYAMMLISGNLRLVFVTNHIPLREVSARVKKEKVLAVIKLANEALILQGISSPKIAVAGLNPHSGDGGALGTEEIEQITPAISEAQSQDISAIGPVPPDTVFIGARDGKYDAVISMYHDHGSTGMKLLGFRSIVTVLIGIPIVRTSVGHGTAFDIAGKGIADHHNLLEAALVAARMARVMRGSGLARASEVR